MHLNPLDFFLKHIETHGETWEYTVLAVFILRFAGGHDTSIPHMEVIYRLLGVQVNVGDRWGAVKHYFIRCLIRASIKMYPQAETTHLSKTWFTDFSKTKSTLLGTNLQTWSVQVKMLLTNLLTWRVLQTWRVQVNEE